MFTLKKNISVIAGILFIFSPIAVAHALSSEIHVTKDGKANISSAKVMQIVTNTFFTRLYWGDAFARFTIRANSGTKFFRATGEQTTIAEIKEGDILDVTGELEPQSNVLTINASSIKNSSVQKEQTTMSGTVTAVDLTARQFILNDKKRGAVTVTIASSTQFIKGTRTLDLEHLRVGDRITKVSGDYDIPSKTLAADFVKTYIDLNQFKPQLFIGKLLETPASPDVPSIKISIKKIPYTAFLTNKTLIMRNNKSTTTLQRFVAGDLIRLYGTMREVDDALIDAEVIKNTNL